MVEQNINQDWKEEITPKTATLKIQDGEKAVFVFSDEGVKKEHADYGKSIAFICKVIEMNKIVEGNLFVIAPKEDEAVKTFYVKANNFDLLGQIKELAKVNSNSLIGLKVEISRKGKLRSDTRYTIKKV